LFRPRVCARVKVMPGKFLRQRLAVFFAVLVAATALFSAGCADGPVPELRGLNPWTRRQWEEDEREITTYHRKVADLAALRDKAPRMAPAERDTVAFQLSERLKEEKSIALRAELVRTLGAFPSNLAEQSVIASLADEAENVRIAAVKALGARPSDAGFQALAQKVSGDTALDVRIAAAKELGKFREFEAPRALRPALDERDPALQLAAMQSLAALTGHSEYRASAETWREFLDGGTPAPPEGPSVAEVVKQYWNWY
jgi:hypothetical protein